MYRHLLVPIDASPLSQVTVEQALDLAERLGARITFVHVRSGSGASPDGTVPRALSPAASAEGAARGLLAKAEAAAAARAGRVEFGSRVVTGDRVAEAILQAARREACDLIFIASRGERGLKRWLHGSVTHGVIDQSPIAVLVAAVEANGDAGDQARAIAVLKDEHRSQAAVMNGLLRAVQAASPDFSLLGAMLSYIESFPQRLHHPKEDDFLFRLVRQRTRECDALLDRLQQQHRQGVSDLGRLRELLSAWRHGDAQAGKAFAEAAAAFVEGQWVHMSQEEDVLLPAAIRHLSAEDWKAIACAFADNDDPEFHEDLGESYEALFRRLMSLAPDGASNPGPGASAVAPS